jgi:hypothetical protein
VVVQVSDGSLIQRRPLCGGGFVALPPREARHVDAKRNTEKRLVRLCLRLRRTHTVRETVRRRSEEDTVRDTVRETVREEAR